MSLVMILPFSDLVSKLLHTTTKIIIDFFSSLLSAESTKEISVCVNSYWESKGVEIVGDKYAMLAPFFFFFLFFVFFFAPALLSSQILLVLSSGADDLLPIIAFVIVKANPPSLKSQTVFLGEFINEMMAMGEEGYSLATLETALDFLDNFDQDRTKRPSAST